jgi:hypothetical protein
MLTALQSSMQILETNNEQIASNDRIYQEENFPHIKMFRKKIIGRIVVYILMCKPFSLSKIILSTKSIQLLFRYAKYSLHIKGKIFIYVLYNKVR